MQASKQASKQEEGTNALYDLEQGYIMEWNGTEQCDAMEEGNWDIESSVRSEQFNQIRRRR